MPSVLIIEPDLEMLQVLALTLQEMGLEVAFCHSVFQGLQRMRNFSPDLITTNLSVENGGTCFDLFQAIRELPTRPPVIVISGCDTPTTITEVMHKGAFEYLVKPLNGARFRSVVERAIQFGGMPRPESAPNLNPSVFPDPVFCSFAPVKPRARRSELVFMVTVICLSLVWLFPPWLHSVREGRDSLEVNHAHGYFFLFDLAQGEQPETRQYLDTRIDFGRLAAESVVVLVIGVGILQFLKRRN